MSTSSIDFLGRSQTFLGVLATIIILFIIANNSNLIQEILKEVKLKIKGTVEHLQVNTDMSDLLNSPSFKLICMYQEKPDADVLLKNDASKWVVTVTASRSELQTKYAAVEFNDDQLLKKIEDSKEQSLAPLYSFVFCLILFVFDELLRAYSIGCNNFLLSSLSIFVLLSYLFWIVVWFNFVRYMRNNLNQMMQVGTRGDMILIKLISLFTKLKTPYCQYIEFANKSKCILLIYFIIRLVIVGIICVAILYIHTYLNCIGALMFVIIGVVAPVLILGLARLWAVSDYSKLSYVFLCGHLVSLLIMSLFLAAIIIFVSDQLGITNDILMPYSNTMLKVSSFSFIMLNGILLPLLLPYCCYNMYYTTAKKKVEDCEKEAKQIVSELNTNIEEFARKIPSAYFVDSL